MEMLLQGLDGVIVYLDDILVASCTLDEHLNRLAEVLQCLENSGMRLNKQKCFFLRSSIEYLGHVVDKEGIHPMEEKVKASNVPKTYCSQTLSLPTMTPPSH